MSRVGKKPITIPSEVAVSLTEGAITVKGPKGTLDRSVPLQLSIQIEGNQITLRPQDQSQKVRALFGLYRTLIANMVKGVAEGFERVL
jgi:large subunit ribosomal protein L6